MEKHSSSLSTIVDKEIEKLKGLKQKKISRNVDLSRECERYLYANEKLTALVKASGSENTSVLSNLRALEVVRDLGPELFGDEESAYRLVEKALLRPPREDLSQICEKAEQAMRLDVQEVFQHWELYSGVRAAERKGLEASVMEKLERVELMKVEVERLKLAEWERRLDLCLVMTKHSENLHRILSTYAIESFPAATKLEVQSLFEKAKTIVAKLRALKAELMAQTYTTETVSSLRAVRRELEQKLLEASREYERVKKLKMEYNSVASLGFSEVAEDYMRVVDQLRHLQWTLQKLDS